MNRAPSTRPRPRRTPTGEQVKVDTVIVGAGSAGLSALREVRRYTEDFLLVNDGHWGTTCAAVGCMPSKALIEAANSFHRRGTFEDFGIRGRGRPSRRRSCRSRPCAPDARRFRQGAGDRCRTSLASAPSSGRARLLGPGRLAVSGDDDPGARDHPRPGQPPGRARTVAAFGDRILTTDSFSNRTTCRAASR